MLLETFPAFIVTDQARDRLQSGGLTGLRFGDVEVSVSDQFPEMHPGRELPSFVGLEPQGRCGEDDVATAPDGHLVLSRRALDVLESLGIAHALIEPFPA